MNGEAAPAPDVGLLELVDCVLGGIDYCKNARREILAFKRVVRLVPGALQSIVNAIDGIRVRTESVRTEAAA